MLRTILPASWFSPETPVQAQPQAPSDTPVAGDEFVDVKAEQEQEAQKQKAAEEKAAQEKAETERLIALGKRYETDTAAITAEAKAQQLAAEMKAKQEKEAITKQLAQTQKELAKVTELNKGLIDSSAGFIEELDLLQPALSKTKEQLAQTRELLRSEQSDNLELREDNGLIKTELLSTRRTLHEKTAKIKDLTHQVAVLTETNTKQAKLLTEFSAAAAAQKARADKAEEREKKAEELASIFKARIPEKEESISNAGFFARTHNAPAVHKPLRLGR